ncbi:threonine ammonia-lyase [Haloglomus litoreum]|uniref:threonine ammonia-lyase n=1 Tax=Haloglomus litoreum TaxID=3034026 RepID=UPI0023E8A066|nr:threonine ammonia-lyase [Haloglomus sp. DT116]
MTRPAPASDGDGPRLGIEDIRAARTRLDGAPDVVKRTPVEYSRSLSELVGGAVHLKMEHLQWTGSFKPRGAYNAIAQLADEDGARPVVAASAGNHAQGVALAGTELGVDVTIVMPKTAPQTKIDATAGYGAEVVLEGRDFRGAMDHARSLVDGTDAAFIHAYDDPDIVAGQGTLGLELYEDCPTLDTVVVPIGGGGLVSGVATALSHVAPDVRVVGVQAEGAATVPDSLDKGAPHTVADVDTVADGIATGGISALTYDHIADHVDQVVTVTDDEISRAVLVLLERAKQVVEGAGAASVAALLGDDLDVADETVVPLLSGGNLDMTMLRTIVTHALTEREQLIRLRIRIDDEPGKMEEIAGVIADHGANIRTVRHDREVEDLTIGEAYLDFHIQTSGHEQTARIVTGMEERGYAVTRLN